MRTTLTGTSASTGQSRKPYATPQLVTYGYVKDIVKGKNGANSDHGQGSNSRLGGT
jgi:hypothetical protein